MKKILLTIVTLCSLCAYAVSQDDAEKKSQKDFNNMVMPMLSFKTVQTAEEDFILSPAINAQYMRMKNEGVESSQPDYLVIGAGYSLDHFTTGLGPDKVDNLHNCNLMGNFGWGKHSFLAMVASGGEVPFSSIQTISGAVMYTYQFISTEHISFIFGGGVVFGDLGIEIEDFKLYALPLPVLSFNYQNDYVATGISVMGLPTAQLVLFPKSMFRFNGSCGLAGFDSIRDLTFDCALAYYPFVNTDAGDFLSVSAGVMNTTSSYKLKDKSQYGYQYYTAYGEINASLVQLRCGYTFDGKVRKDSKDIADMYKGGYASIQAMYMF